MPELFLRRVRQQDGACHPQGPPVEGGLPESLQEKTRRRQESAGEFPGDAGTARPGQGGPEPGRAEGQEVHRSLQQSRHLPAGTPGAGALDPVRPLGQELPQLLPRHRQIPLPLHHGEHDPALECQEGAQGEAGQGVRRARIRDHLLRGHGQRDQSQRRQLQEDRHGPRLHHPGAGP